MRDRLERIADVSELGEEGGKFAEGDLVGSVRQGLGWIFVGFDEEAVATSGYSRSCEDGGKMAVATRVVSSPAGSLNRVGGIKHNVQSQFLHPIYGTHVCDKIIVTETGSPLGKKEGFASGKSQFFRDIFYIPRRKELTFFDIHRPAGGTGCGDEIGLAAQEGRNLEHIEKLACDFDFAGGMDVGCHRHSQIGTDFCEQLASVMDPQTSEGMGRRAIGFVVGSLENEADAFAIADGFEFPGHPAREGRALNDTGAKDEEEFAAPDRARAQGERHALRGARTLGGHTGGALAQDFSSHRKEKTGEPRIRRRLHGEQAGIPPVL